MSKVLTRTELANVVSQDLGISQRAANEAIGSVLTIISDHFIRGGEAVSLRGFGTFKAKKRLGFMGRNPKTGEVVDIPTRASIGFKPSNEIRKAMNS